MDKIAKKADEISSRSDDPYKNTQVKSALRPKSQASVDPVKAYTQSLQRQYNVKEFKAAHISVIAAGRQHMRIGTNDAHNMKTNNGYARKACGGFYKIM